MCRYKLYWLITILIVRLFAEGGFKCKGPAHPEEACVKCALGVYVLWSVHFLDAFYIFLGPMYGLLLCIFVGVFMSTL